MEQKIEYIERFFSGDMSDAERSEFEKRRSDDRSFDEEVTLYLNAREVIRFQSEKRLKEQLDTIGKQQAAVDIVNSYVRYRILRKVWLPAAASIIIIGTLAYFALSGVFRQNKFDSYLALYNNFYEKPGIEQVTTRSSDDDDQSFLWYSALNKYSNSDYQGAVKDFGALLKSPEFKQPSAASFYAGVSYLNLNRTDSAIILLGTVSKASSFFYDAEWYIALSHIKAGNLAESRKFLNRIVDSKNHPRRKEAAKLLKDISKLDAGLFTPYSLMFAPL